MIGYIIGAIGVAVGVACIYQLYRWERQLRGARVVVAYKGKTKMTMRLIDLLKWALTLQRDKNSRGRAIYKMGSTTIALAKPLPRSHGKTTTKTVKEP